MRSMEKIKGATIVVTVLVGLFAIATVARAANERFKAILSSGVLRVGVEQALKPWSFRDTNGQLIGFEVDLANEVADTLGVGLSSSPSNLRTGCNPAAGKGRSVDRRDGGYSRAAQ